ncbi:hypothetical protein [Pedobacter nototheniae]|uniref:hypothetical protein n=1 Tax=Pedobacter nototheniae TaxID=2488994 RepID=UPI00103D2135|nr:hypothetical protein [Pedobacter nototheniae]
MKKILIVVYILVMLIPIGVIIYFVGGVSRQTPPIQSYEYQGSVNELIIDIDRYSKLRSNGKYFITDTVGNVKDDYAIRLTIELKANNNIIEFGLKLEPQGKAVRSKTNVYLTKAYNKTLISGGYQAESVGIKPLVDFFNSDFVSKIKRLHKIE